MPRSIARGCSPELLPLHRDRQGVVIWLLVTVVSLLNLSCSDGPGSVAGVGDVSGLEISPGQLVLDDGETMELSARLKDRAGNVVSVLSDRGAVDWTVTPRDVVTISADGLLNALRPGSARVKAEYGNLNAWADVEVLPVPVELASAMTEGVRGTAGRELADSVSVVVLDRHHLPAVGIAVEFIVAAGTGHVSADRVETGPDGAARVAWTLGSEAGANQLRATVAGLDPLTIDAEALADVLSSELLLVSGNNQVGEVGQPLSDPLVVRAVDQYGNPVRGIAVNWLFASLWADGTTTVQGLETMISGPDGIAEIEWVLGPQVGDHIATATIMGSSAAAAQSVAGMGSGSDLSITRQRFSARGQPGEPRNIVFTPPNPSVPVGATLQMTGVVVDVYKNPTPDQTFTWGVSRPSVATISASGLVTGISAGKSDILGWKNGRWAKTKLTVLASAPGAILKASGDGQTGTVGTRLPNPLAAKVVDGGGSPMAGVSVQWSVTRGNGSVAAGSSDTDASGVARIDLTLGLTAGANEVTASAPGSTGSVVFSATGFAGPAANVTVSPSYASLDVSDTQQMTTTVKDGHGNPITGASVAWSSTNTSVATTSANGLVAAVGGGVADIRATSGSASGTARVDVGTTQPLTAPTTLNLSLGSILPATDEIEILADWSAVSTAPGYGWSFAGGSSSPAQSGHDTDRAETIVVDQITSSYTATVCAWATRGTETGPQKCGTVSIPARSSAPPTITGLTVSPTGATLDSSDTQRFTAAAQMSDGSTATVSVSWSATGGTVSTAGLYTAGSTAGSFQVTATEPGSGLTATALITVQAPPSGPQPLTAPASVNLSLGASSGVRAIDLNTDWSSVTGADRYGWDFDGETMSPPQDGETTGTSETLVIAQRYKAYTATVCVWALRGATEVGPQTCSQITVPKEGATPPPPPTLSGVTVSPGSVSIDQGDTQQFTATGVMSDGTTQSVSVAWSALGGSISSGGLYTAGSIDGSYTVTATETATGLSGSANVTVTDPSAPPPTVVQIVIQPGSTSLYQGGSQQYSCHAVMSDGTTQTGMTVNWSATGGSISPAGYYTAGNSNGNYQVTVVDPASGMSATSSVDVSTPPPPPPPPPSGGLVLDNDYSSIALSSVGGFFWDCQATASCPNGETAKLNGGIQLVSDATYGQVLRINQEASGTISYRGTVKGRFSVAPDSVVWFQSLVRYASNWDAAVRSSYKYNFFYISNGGSQRLQKCCGGPGGQMSHGFGGGTAYSGNPSLQAGRDNSGWWTSSPQWVRVTGWYIREGGDISSGWLIEELGGAGRHAFWGGRLNGVPEALNGTNTSGHGPMVVYRVSQGENINNPPAQDTHIDYASIRAWTGVQDPLGLLNQVR